MKDYSNNSITDPHINNHFSYKHIETQLDHAQKEHMPELSEERYKLLFDHSPFPIFIYSLDTLAINEVNNAAIQLYGFSRKEFLEMTMLDIRPEEDIPIALKILDLFKQQKKIFYHTELRHKNKQGQVINVEVTTHEIHTQAGRQIIATINNITEKVQLQQRVLNEKLSAQKQIARAIIATQEKERSEIGKELHDNVNQILTTAKLYVENINYYPEQASQFVQKSIALLQKSISEIRFLSKALVTPTIRDIGFKETLLELLDAYQELHLFIINPQLIFEEEGISKEVKLTIYRILQEALNNTVKYAQATSVTVKIAMQSNALIVMYKDDGIGFDPEVAKPGLGLRNIKNRVEVYKGTVSLQASPGEGCCIDITFPL